MPAKKKKLFILENKSAYINAKSVKNNIQFVMKTEFISDEICKPFILCVKFVKII